MVFSIISHRHTSRQAAYFSCGTSKKFGRASLIRENWIWQMVLSSSWRAYVRATRVTHSRVPRWWVLRIHHSNGISEVTSKNVVVCPDFPEESETNRLKYLW